MTNKELKEKIESDFDDAIEVGAFIDYDKDGFKAILKSHIDFAIEQLLRAVKLYHTSNSIAIVKGGKTQTIGEIVAIQINELQKQKEEL